MNILYYGLEGSASNSVMGIILVILGIIIGTSLVILTIIEKDTTFLVGLIFVFVLIAGSAACFHDTRIPIVKATIDENVSWQSIQDKYEFYKQEGHIYTLKVKNVDIDDWVTTINENN